MPLFNQQQYQHLMDEETPLIKKLANSWNYELHKKLTQGAYGQIYSVVSCQNPKEKYALKVVELQRVRKLQKMYQIVIEVKLLKKLSHPGIIKLIQVIRMQNYLGIVMQLAPNGDLFSLINYLHNNSSPSILHKSTSFYLAQALQIIDYLHSLQIAHRDIKPENFVITADFKLQLIDFATALIPKQTHLFSQEELAEMKAPQEEGLIGSANYLSPENLKLNYSCKCDIWAFGILAHKFFFNSLPFEGSSEVQIFQQILEAEINLDKATPEIQELLVLCLKKDPSERPTAKMLKLCSIFKGLNFKDIFQMVPPISQTDIAAKPKKTSVILATQPLLSMQVEKKMFFGNFKPRVLTISMKQEGLLMDYRYVQNGEVKRQFSLGVNDFAWALQGREFEVSVRGKSYVFRVGEGESASKAADKINKLIRETYHLE